MENCDYALTEGNYDIVIDGCAGKRVAFGREKHWREALFP